jgi:hypothetical protein
MKAAISWCEMREKEKLVSRSLLAHGTVFDPSTEIDTPTDNAALHITEADEW